METHSTMKEKETAISKMEELEKRLTQRFSTKLEKIATLFSEMNQQVAAMKESVHGITPNNIASSSHVRSSLRIDPLRVRSQVQLPSSHHLEPGGGRSSPSPTFFGFSKLAKEELVEVFSDPMAELKQLKETNGIVEYHSKFEFISSRANLSEPYLVNAFLAGLRLDTQSYTQWFQPQTVHQCLVIGRMYEKAYPIVCCEEKDTPAGSSTGDEFVDPVFDTSSSLLMTKGEETLPSVIDFGLEALETNTSVIGIGSSAVEEEQATCLIHEEDSHPEKEKETIPEMFLQIAAVENKVSISLLESEYNDDQEVKELAAESIQKIEHSVFENSVDAPRTYNLIDRAEFSQKRVGVLHLNIMAVSVENSLSFRTSLCAFKLLQESRESRQGLLSKMPKSWHFKYKLQEQQYMKTQLLSQDVSSLATALNMSTAESTAQIQLEELKHRFLQRRTQSLVPNSQSQFHSSLVLHVISSGVSSEMWLTHQNRIPYVLPVEKVKVTTLKSTAGIDKETAPQKFDKQVHQTEYLTTKEKQMTCFISWRFKFKQKQEHAVEALQVEDSGAVLSHLVPLKEIAGHDWDETLFGEDKLEHRRLKKTSQDLVI